MHYAAVYPLAVPTQDAERIVIGIPDVQNEREPQPIGQTELIGKPKALP
jgi:hypothetical protein